MMQKTMLLAVLASFPFASFGCADGEQTSERLTGALETCTFGAPVITEMTEERPGPVAPGVTKVYHVTARNTDSTGCAPAVFTFVPDSFHYVSTVVQPGNISGIAPGALASFRVQISSVTALAEGTYNVGFTIVNVPGGTTVRSSLAYEVTLTNPVGCNHQAPQISVDPASPPPVAAGNAQTYQVTVRNVDNAECGLDSFMMVPDSFHFFSLSSDGPLTIVAGGSAAFTLTASSSTEVLPGIYDLGFTVIGAHHGSVTNRGTVRYQVR